MSFMKIEQGYKRCINDYIHQKKQFIDSVKDAIRRQTTDKDEKKYRLETFDALLLKATYAKQEDLIEAINNSLSSLNDNTMGYISRQLMEINGFCTKSFSDEHEGYSNIYNSITFLTPDIKSAVREQLGSGLTEMIFDKTGAFNLDRNIQAINAPI